jgi:hypothetical protein
MEQWKNPRHNVLLIQISSGDRIVAKIENVAKVKTITFCENT